MSAEKRGRQSAFMPLAMLMVARPEFGCLRDGNRGARIPADLFSLRTGGTNLLAAGIRLHHCHIGFASGCADGDPRVLLLPSSRRGGDSFLVVRLKRGYRRILESGAGLSQNDHRGVCDLTYRCRCSRAISGRRVPSGIQRRQPHYSHDWAARNFHERVDARRIDRAITLEANTGDGHNRAANGTSGARRRHPGALFHGARRQAERERSGT